MSQSFYEIFCLLCCPPWPPKIAEKIIFQPPAPSYFFGFVSDRYQMVALNNSLGSGQEWQSTNVECMYGTSSRGNKIACVMVKCTADSKYTVLFSHGNAADLGQMCLFYYDLGTLIDCNIFSYDYSGYGASSGKPSEKNLYADIQCAWDTLQHRYRIPPDQIIVYGMSLGSVPTIDLAARLEVGAVILQSPITSALRVLNPDRKRTYFWDSFSTIEKVPAISSPVLVIHGTEDEIVPFSHGVAIYENCECRVAPLWIEGAGHNDMEGYSQYMERLKLFIHVEIEHYTLALRATKAEPEPFYFRGSSTRRSSSKDKKSLVATNPIRPTDSYLSIATSQEANELLEVMALKNQIQCTSRKNCDQYDQ